MQIFNISMKNNPLAKALIRFISNNPLYKGVLVLGSGTVLAQLIGIVTLPIITRLYSPSDLGVLAVYSSILSIVVVAASFRYEFAYPLPKQDETAANLFALCLLLLIVTSIGFTFVILFAGDILVTVFHLESLVQYLWLLILGFFGMGLYTILNHWAIRQRDYRRITYTKINQSASGAACKILLGFISYGPIGLIIGQIVSQVFGVSTFSRAMWKTEWDSLRKISIDGIKSVAKEYWSFPAFNLPASIVNTLSLQVPALMLLAIYGSQTVGLYALAQSLLVLPGSVISTSLAQAFLGEASKMVREDSLELKPLYITTVRHLSLIAVPLIGIPALLAPIVVPIIFGEVWIDAGWYCLPLALMVIPQFVVSPTSKLTIYGYNHWMLMWDITRVFGILVGFYVSQLFGLPVIMTVTIYALIMFAMYLFLIILNLKAISNFTQLVGSYRTE
ncbi:polysaccharide biosynthesis protein [Methanoculleus taiwanensis]|uniref:Polysaccharide biosynthesis protein n=1 Tax=Methanoculleus taiwanensis TaxID=1550565 RepID=A0A498GWN9_9EURY|nr:oligosaccharide flippase family protein [Methanoculleus taiwanensis]RXE55291.1 polysaccharide biosynthesis protein [Methanoculleus taiwanensis]